MNSCFLPPQATDPASSGSVGNLNFAQKVDYLDGKHYVSANKSSVALTCPTGARTCYEYSFGWSHRIQFSKANKFLNMTHLELGLNDSEQETYKKDADLDFSLLGEGEALRYRGRIYVRFDEIQSTDLFLKDSVWEVDVAAQSCLDPESGGQWQNSISISQDMLVRTSQRGIGCGLWTLEYSEAPLQNENVRRISSDRQWLWLKEGIYRLKN